MCVVSTLGFEALCGTKDLNETLERSHASKIGKKGKNENVGMLPNASSSSLFSNRRAFSVKKARNFVVSFAASEIVTYSTSVVKSTMMDCLKLFQLTVSPLHMNTYLHVDFLSSGSNMKFKLV